MASHSISASSNLVSSMDEQQQWMIQIREALEGVLEENHEKYENNPVSIFTVPRPLRYIKPESYTPHLVSIGPYHLGCPDLNEMQTTHKLISARRTQKQLMKCNHTFETVVEHVSFMESKIRRCYHKYLNVSSEMLSWVMAIDSSFLLDFLQKLYSAKSILSCTTLMMRRRILNSNENVILRDLVMVENQIPMSVLRKVMELQCESSEAADDALALMLNSLSRDLSPFKLVNQLSSVQISQQCAHMLDFLYQTTVVPNNYCQEIREERRGGEDADHDSQLEVQIVEIDERVYDQRHAHDLKGKYSEWKKGFRDNFMKLKDLVSRPAKALLIRIPLILLMCNIPAFTMFKGLIENLLASSTTNNNNDKTPKENDNNQNRCNVLPLMEEIKIPSVSELYNSGISLLPTSGGIETITFNSETKTLSLPIISLDENSEVILRNLVAYEACRWSSSLHPLVLARYTELMNGIIDTEEDARLLREHDILLNHLKSDEEVANLWNSMNKSLSLTRVPWLDQVIEDVNHYYDSSWKVKVRRFMKAHVYGSWQVLTFFAAVFLLFLMTLEVLSTLFGVTRMMGGGPRSRPRS